MNKTIKSVLIFVLAIPFLGQSQSVTHKKTVDTAASLRVKNTYVDAIKLSKIFSILRNPINNDNKKELKLALDSLNSILSSYYWNRDNSDNMIFTGLLNLNQNISAFKQLSMGSRGFDGTTAAPIPSYSGASEEFSSNPEAAALNAVATFMAKRAEEEVLYCALNKIMDIGVDNKSTIGKKFKILFPGTAKLIAKLKQGGVYYPSDFSLIKQMMEIDLQNLPNTLPDVIKFSDSTVNDMEKLVGQTYLMLRDGKKVQSLIDTLGNYNWKDANFKTTANYFVLFSNALKDTAGTKNIWISESEMQALGPKTRDTVLRDFFYGLLYQQMKYQKETFVKNICNSVQSKEDAINFSIQMEKIKSIAFDLNSLKDSLSQSKNKDPNWILNRTAQSINCLNDIATIEHFYGHITIPSEYAACIDQGIETARLIQNKNYNAALSYLVTSMAQDSSISTSDLRKISFFIQLSQMKDESQFTAFIESYAAPIGSSSLKRTSKFNLTLNGYVGLNGGYEWITNSATGNKNNGAYWGIAGPIGLTMSFFPSKRGSFSLFFSFLDLGSLVNVRLNNDSTNYSNIKLDQFFSPGIGLYYNIKGTPLTFGGYICKINDIRNIQYSTSTATITETGRDVVRLNFSALIDIPFFTLSNKERVLK